MSNCEASNIRSLTLNVNEVAQLLGVSRRSVYRLLDAKKIPKPLKFGNATRWRRRDIEMFVEAGSVRAFRRAKQG